MLPRVEDPVLGIVKNIQSTSSQVFIKHPEPALIKQDDPNALTKIRDNLLLLDQLKLPPSKYRCQRKKVSMEGVSKNLLLISCDLTNNQTALTDEEKEHKKKYCNAIRKLSLIGGILTHLKSNHFLTASKEQQESIQKILIKNANEILSALKSGEKKTVNSKEDTDSFINQLSKEISAITKEKTSDIIDKIWKAERYFIAEYDNGTILATETILPPTAVQSTSHPDQTQEKQAEQAIGKEKGARMLTKLREKQFNIGEAKKLLSNNAYFQIDVPCTQLTQELKNEFSAIYDTPPPYWFSVLSEWEKEWLKERIPDPATKTMTFAAYEAALDQFATIFQSSAMENLPGIKNARTNYLIMKNDRGQFEIVSQSMKSSSFVPYEVPDDQTSSSECLRLTCLNAEQVLREAEKQAEQRFNSKWGNLFEEGESFPKPLILIETLLSDIATIAKSDLKLANLQNEAIDSLIENNKLRSCDLFRLGDPTNNLGKAVEVQSLVLPQSIFAKRQSPHSQRWKKIEELLLYAFRFRSMIEAKAQSQKLTPSQKRDLAILNEAILSLQRLETKRSFTSSMNKRALKAAYTEILVEAMGGMVVSHCKSGKDRTGLDEIEKHALHIYQIRHGKLLDPNVIFDTKHPEYTATREKYTQIMLELLISQKIQVAAGRNALGSDGIKDNESSGILHTEVRKKGGQELLSYEDASANKPPSFKKAEKDAKEARELLAMGDKGIQSPSSFASHRKS